MTKKYTKEHEWVELLEGNRCRVGITDYAQEQLGDIVVVELPDLEKQVSEGQEFIVIESVKAASDVYAPLKGKVVSLNEELTDNPALVNESAEDSGWLVELEIENTSDLENLMDADAYQEFVKENG